MPKKIISDIFPSKKSIRQIPLSKEKIGEYKDLKREVISLEENKRDNSRHHKVNRTPNWQRKTMNPKLIIWLIAIICLLALFFGISIIFSSATVIITPRAEKITFTNEPYTAKLNSQSTTTLSFEILKVKQDGGKVIPATEEKEVTQKATGKIVIYNNYSISPQRLITQTRFEAGNGKIYKINSSVIVPGFKKSGDKIIPGSVEATVFADQPGTDYNLNLADLKGDFKIPGFKGDVRYQGFYARASTDITGGFIGKQRVVNAELRKTTEDSIKTDLKEQLLKELYAIKPDNYIIFKDAYSVDYKNLADTNVNNNEVKINIEGSLNGIVFNNLKLTKYLANKKIDSFDGLPAELIPTDNLVVTLTGADSTGLWKNDTLQIKFSGDAVVKWLYDGDLIKRQLAGRSQADLQVLTSQFKDSVAGIKVQFRPVWTKYFPDNLSKIKISEEN